MEEVYLALKRGVEAETETLKDKFDELQARVLEADAKRDQVHRLGCIRVGMYVP